MCGFLYIYLGENKRNTWAIYERCVADVYRTNETVHDRTQRDTDDRAGKLLCRCFVPAEHSYVQFALFEAMPYSKDSKPAVP